MRQLLGAGPHRTGQRAGSRACHQHADRDAEGRKPPRTKRGHPRTDGSEDPTQAARARPGLRRAQGSGAGRRRGARRLGGAGRRGHRSLGRRPGSARSTRPRSDVDYTVGSPSERHRARPGRSPRRRRSSSSPRSAVCHCRDRTRRGQRERRGRKAARRFGNEHPRRGGLRARAHRSRCPVGLAEASRGTHLARRPDPRGQRVTLSSTSLRATIRSPRPPFRCSCKG